jgi:hypothetical protein
VRRGDLRNPNGPRGARWDWGWLDGAFGDTKISVSDIDAIIERRGHFLIFEIKRTEEALHLGQFLLLQALARQPRTTVLLVRGERKDHPDSYQTLTAEGLSEPQTTSQEDFRRRVGLWFQRVDVPGLQSGSTRDLAPEARPRTCTSCDMPESFGQLTQHVSRFRTEWLCSACDTAQYPTLGNGGRDHD